MGHLQATWQLQAYNPVLVGAKQTSLGCKRNQDETSIATPTRVEGSLQLQAKAAPP